MGSYDMPPTKHEMYVGMSVHSIIGIWGELPRLFSPDGRMLLANVQIEMSSELRCISALDGRRDTMRGSGWKWRFRWRAVIFWEDMLR